MRIVQKITEKLINALDYYVETHDTNELIFDIQEIITDLTIGNIE